MQLLAWYRIIPIFVTISSLVFNTEAYPIKPVHADTPNPPSAKSFLSGIRRSSSPEKVDAGLVCTEEKISKMTPAQRSKLKKELDEMVHGPKPKTRLGRLWDRILKFFQRRPSLAGHCVVPALRSVRTNTLIACRQHSMVSAQTVTKTNYNISGYHRII